MKLFEITNGYMGDCYVRILVIAKDEKTALAMAKDKYKKEADGYPSQYWKRLKAEVLCEDTSALWCGEVNR